MESIINEKKRLHETLLSFPPFYTYFEPHLACKSMKSRGRSKLDIGASSFILIAGSKAENI